MQGVIHLYSLIKEIFLFRFFNQTFCYHAMNSDEENLRIIPNDKDLHVFIPDVKNLMNSMEKSFSKFYSQRNLTSQEIWLLDVSAWPLIEDAKEILNNIIANLDIDDDLYLYSYDKKSFLVEIWEFYRKHESKPTNLEFHGNWNEFLGLEVLVAEKWKRRGNLEVQFNPDIVAIKIGVFPDIGVNLTF